MRRTSSFTFTRTSVRAVCVIWMIVDRFDFDERTNERDEFCCRGSRDCYEIKISFNPMMAGLISIDRSPPFLAHDYQGGKWLIHKGEFNAGVHINSMFRLKCKVTDPSQDKSSTLADKRQITYCSKLVQRPSELNFLRTSVDQVCHGSADYGQLYFLNSSAYSNYWPVSHFTSCGT